MATFNSVANSSSSNDAVISFLIRYLMPYHYSFLFFLLGQSLPKKPNAPLFLTSSGWNSAGMFLEWIRIYRWSQILDTMSYIKKVAMMSFHKKSLKLRCFKSDWDEIRQEVPRVIMHQITESDFRYDIILKRWRPWHHFTKKPKSLRLRCFKSDPDEILPECCSNEHTLTESDFRFDLIILRRQPWCHFV